MRERGWLWVVGVVMFVVPVAGGCGMEKSHSLGDDDEADAPAVSAAHLGDRYEERALADLLEPEERAAAQKAGLPVGEERLAEQADQPDQPDAANADPESGKFARTADKAAQVGMSLLMVGVTVGAMVAPYLLL